MGLRIIDISNHQSGMDVESVVRQNDVAAVFILTNDGTFVNGYFHAQADAAERAGAIVLPYVYLRPNWAQTIDIHLNVVGSRYNGSIVDIEDGSGGWNECWNAHNRLWNAGRDTPLLYWPRYHWQSMGSPDLSPLASRVRGHWKSWYPDTVARGFDAGLTQVPGYVWDDNRGGILTRIVQFTGTGRLNGYGGNLDLNYFPGSRAELAALLGGDDIMTPNDGNVPFAAPHPENSAHVETHKFADWLGFAAYRGADSVQLLRKHELIQAEILNAVTGDDFDPQEALARMEKGAREGAHQAVTTVVVPVLRDAVREVFGEDNEALVEAFLNGLGKRLTPAQLS